MDYLDNLKYKINNDIDSIEVKILRRLFKELMMEILNLKERELKKRTIRRFIADSVDFNSLDIKISDEILKNVNLYFILKAEQQ